MSKISKNKGREIVHMLRGFRDFYIIGIEKNGGNLTFSGELLKPADNDDIRRRFLYMTAEAVEKGIRNFNLKYKKASEYEVDSEKARQFKEKRSEELGKCAAEDGGNSLSGPSAPEKA